MRKETIESLKVRANFLNGLWWRLKVRVTQVLMYTYDDMICLSLQSKGHYIHFSDRGEASCIYKI